MVLVPFLLALAAPAAPAIVLSQGGEGPTAALDTRCRVTSQSRDAQDVECVIAPARGEPAAVMRISVQTSRAPACRALGAEAVAMPAAGSEPRAGALPTVVQEVPAPACPR